VSVLGALLASKASSSIAHGLAAAGMALPAGGGHRVPAVSQLPAPVAHIVEHAYASGIAEVFLLAAPLGLVAMGAVALMHEAPLGTKSGIELTRDELAQPQPA
jgi:hypothetical protein